MILLVSGFEGLMLCRQDAARSATKGICGVALLGCCHRKQVHQVWVYL
ncbi:unnamed protein product, partial [Vitis vinifera]